MIEGTSDKKLLELSHHATLTRRETAPTVSALPQVGRISQGCHAYFLNSPRLEDATALLDFTHRSPISYFSGLVASSNSRQRMPGELLPTMAAPSVSKSKLSRAVADLYLIVCRRIRQYYEDSRKLTRW